MFDMNEFKNETQVLQAEACYDIAANRIREEFPEASENSYSEKLWSAIARNVVNDGYEATKDYARNAYFTV